MVPLFDTCDKSSTCSVCGLSQNLPDLSEDEIRTNENHLRYRHQMKHFKDSKFVFIFSRELTIGKTKHRGLHFGVFTWWIVFICGTIQIVLWPSHFRCDYNLSEHLMISLLLSNLLHTLSKYLIFTLLVPQSDRLMISFYLHSDLHLVSVLTQFQPLF